MHGIYILFYLCFNKSDKTMKNILALATVKQFLADKNLIELGFMGKIYEDEYEKCFDALSVEHKIKTHNGVEFNLYVVAEKETGKFIACYIIFNHNGKEQVKEFSKNNYQNAVQQFN